jgi:hypothetical protein
VFGGTEQQLLKIFEVLVSDPLNLEFYGKWYRCKITVRSIVSRANDCFRTRESQYPATESELGFRLI